MGSRMSLNASSADEANDDDDFGDAISIMVHGKPAAPTKRKHHVPGRSVECDYLISTVEPLLNNHP